VEITDVILAVASPPGHSPRGIIRVSGDDTFTLLQPHLTLRDGAPFSLSRGIFRARLSLNDRTIPVLALIFPGRNSYTGQDSLELQLPGNPVLLHRIIDAIIESAAARNLSARRAGPGEFTARAFFNDRLTLTQAEGVAATIAARSDAELRAASTLRDGALGDFAATLADDLAAALALVEAGIDFTDQEDVVAITPADLHDRLTDLARNITNHLDRSVGIEQLQAIPWVVLTGEPNAGKSTLFNALLGRSRAVVAAQPGVTRDVLAEPLTITTGHGPAEVMLVDAFRPPPATRGSTPNSSCTVLRQMTNCRLTRTTAP